jgi:hypothetical protein
LSAGPEIDEGSYIIVVEVDRLTLFVAPLLRKTRDNSGVGQNLERAKENTNKNR